MRDNYYRQTTNKSSIGIMAGILALLVVLAFCPVVHAGGGSSTPKDFTVRPPDSSLGGSLLLSWRAEDLSRVGEYRVFRSEEKDSGFRMVYSSPVEMKVGDQMDHVDTGLEDGRSYYYAVSLLDRSGVELGTTPVVRGTLPAVLGTSSPAFRGKRIVISVADQRAYFLEDEVLIKSHLVSTGLDSTPTPYGLFRVLYHQQLLISVKYGGLYLYWWMGFAPDTGMHAIPYNPKTKTWIGGGSLGRKASRGCVRQALADAEWAYRWAPDGTRLEVVPQSFRPPPPPPPAPKWTGGHGSQGISEAGQQWYFAEGYTGGNFSTYFTMMNPNHVPADINAVYMKPDGSTVNGTYQVDPLARYTIDARRVSGLEDSEFSTRLESSQSIVAERSMYFDFRGRAGGSNSVGVPGPQKTWYLAEGFTGGEFDEYVLIQNPNAYPVIARATFMKGSGLSEEKEYQVGALSRYTIHVNEIAELMDSEVSVKVECNDPIIVERAQYFNYYGRDDGSSSTGVVEPSDTWYLAEGYTGGEFSTYVVLQNPNDESAEVEVTYTRSDGDNVISDYLLTPESRFTIRLNDVPGLKDAEVSSVVRSDRDIIVERTMYYVSSGRKGGSDAPGVVRPSTSWYLAEGYTGGDFDTYVVILNPNDQPVTLDVNFLLPGGRIVQAAYQLGASSRHTIHVDSVEGLSNTEVSTALSSSLPIVCERAMYFTVTGR